MNLKTLQDIPPWDWPEDAGKMFLEILSEYQVDEPDRLLAAELVGKMYRMAKTKKKPNQKLQTWIDARKCHHLSHAHVQMARELGTNPKKLGKKDTRSGTLEDAAQAIHQAPLLQAVRFYVTKPEGPKGILNTIQRFFELLGGAPKGCSRRMSPSSNSRDSGRVSEVAGFPNRTAISDMRWQPCPIRERIDAAWAVSRKSSSSSRLGT